MAQYWNALPHLFMMKLFKNTVKIISCHLLLLSILGSSLYNSSLVVMEPQDAAFRLCKNRLALVLKGKADINEASSTQSPDVPQPKTELHSSCFNLFLHVALIKQPQAPCGNALPTHLIPSTTLKGFKEKILQPPRF